MRFIMEQANGNCFLHLIILMLPSNCIVSGTGLTHHSSALNRNVMHQTEAGTLTDSMKVYQWGIEGGKPGEGKIGIQPEWFYKGTGSVLKAHGEALLVPNFGNDGGEEPEIAGMYISLIKKVNQFALDLQRLMSFLIM